MVNMVRKIHAKNQRSREGNVEIEEYEDGGNTTEKSETPQP